MQDVAPWLRRGRSSDPPAKPQPSFIFDVTLASGAQLEDKLLAQGLSPDEVVFKFHRPSYAPPPGAGIPSLVKSENLGRQVERLIAMHEVVPASVPMPIGTVRDEGGELVGYLLEFVDGETLRELIEVGAID